MKKYLLFATLLFVIVSGYSFAESTSTVTTTTGQTAMLGVRLAPVPDALRDQLGNLIPGDQGVLVMDVSPTSPAEKAGIKRNDVILTYADQKLFSAGQLVALVRSDKPGNSEKLKLLRSGEVQTAEVKLGSKSLALQDDDRSMTPWGMPPMPNNSFGIDRPQRPLAWDSFESIQVQTLPDGRYRAEVQYKNDSDQSKSFVFEGKRDEIVDQIQQQKEIPQDKKRALLQALNMSSADDFRDRLFNDPFFQRHFGDDDFFRDFPGMRMPHWWYRH